jgi:glycerophosphoryl diester phosphodiesterase
MDPDVETTAKRMMDLLLETQAKAAGILAFTWTLDGQSAIKEYLNKGAFDGILTNYPSILAYEFYIQE